VVLGRLDSGPVIHHEANDDPHGDGCVAGETTRVEHKVLAQHLDLAAGSRFQKPVTSPGCAWDIGW